MRRSPARSPPHARMGRMGRRYSSLEGPRQPLQGRLPSRDTSRPPRRRLSILRYMAIARFPCADSTRQWPARKKTPGKNGSQGGKGRHPFPGAIGRFGRLQEGPGPAPLVGIWLVRRPENRPGVRINFLVARKNRRALAARGPFADGWFRTVCLESATRRSRLLPSFVSEAAAGVRAGGIRFVGSQRTCALLMRALPRGLRCLAFPARERVHTRPSAALMRRENRTIAARGQGGFRGDKGTPTRVARIQRAGMRNFKRSSRFQAVDWRLQAVGTNQIPRVIPSRAYGLRPWSQRPVSGTSTVTAIPGRSRLFGSATPIFTPNV